MKVHALRVTYGKAVVACGLMSGGNEKYKLTRPPLASFDPSRVTCATCRHTVAFRMLTKQPVFETWT